ncbi:SusC/RagA family TonB-linked outer membrane protein [Algoriphagus pacificus]|nr:TonB-dependent receptor [Algoriphagus pacificus]
MHLNLQKTIYMLSKYFLYGFIVQMLVFNLVLATTAKGQYKSIDQVKVRINQESITLEDFFKSIEKQTPFNFLYDHNQINSEIVFKLNDQIGTVESFLRQISYQSNLRFRQVNNGIDVKENSDLPYVSISEEIKRLEIKGVVLDESGAPLPGVTIIVQGTTQGTVSDVDGKFSFDVQEGDILVFSFIGFEEQTVEVRNQTEFEIRMKENLSSLEEVVVIGYGTQKKSDLTGAVSTIQSEALEQRNSIQLSQALQGMVPGLMVTRSNSAPGSTATIRVRGITTIGDSDPLIIVDGVPIRSINDVNPNDIENISVLKDAASASIYGARAASGVIVITTKRAKEGQLQLNYSLETGFEMPTTSPDYVSAQRYMEFSNEFTWNDLKNTGSEYPVYSKDLIENYEELNRSNPNLYPITDWRSLMFKDKAPRQSHLISLTAGGPTVRNKTTLGYDQVDGLYQGLDYSRFTGRTSTDFVINKYLDATLDMYVRYSISDRPNVDEGTINRFSRVSAPIYAAMWDDGRIAEGKVGDNIYARLVAGGEDKTKATFLTAKAAINFKPTKDLKFTAVLSPQLYSTKVKAFTKQIPYYTADDPTVLGGYISGNNLTNLSESRNESVQINTQFLANYSKSFDKHDFGLLLGFESFFLNQEGLTVISENLSLNKYPYMDLANANILRTGGNASENAYNSYFGRLTYGFNNKYLIQANFRADGSSRFDEKYRWGSFPSVSVGWVITEEEFLKNSGIFSFLKLRGSWGRLGNERIGNYPYQATISFNDALFNQGTNIVALQTAAQTQYAIRDISWESTASYDIGIDMAFFQDRLSFEFDYYEKTTSDMLLPLEIPDFIGFDNPDQNTGKMSTKGWETLLSYRNKVGQFNYSISANLSDFNSVMGDLGGIQFLGSQIKKEGSEFNEWYGYVSDGLFQTQSELDESAVLNSNVKVGDIKYVDISGPNGEPDGVISPEYDRVLLGGSLPRFMYGANLNVSYKSFDLGIVIQGVGKQNSLITEDMVQPFVAGWGNVPALLEGNYWSHYNTDEQNLNAKYPLVSNAGRTINTQMSDYWLFNGKYMRLKALTLGYTLPSVFTQKIKISNARLYSSLNDLFTISNYPKGWDPEVSSTGYPITTSVLFGLSVQF